jgi:hypothetical protein
MRSAIGSRASRRLTADGVRRSVGGSLRGGAQRHPGAGRRLRSVRRDRAADRSPVRLRGPKPRGRRRSGVAACASPGAAAVSGSWARGASESGRAADTGSAASHASSQGRSTAARMARPESMAGCYQNPLDSCGAVLSSARPRSRRPRSIHRPSPAAGATRTHRWPQRSINASGRPCSVSTRSSPSWAVAAWGWSTRPKTSASDAGSPSRSSTRRRGRRRMRTSGSTSRRGPLRRSFTRTW